VDATRKIAILLLLAAAVPATAQTLGFSLGLSARTVCLSIGAATYRVSGSARSDYTVRIGPNEPSPDVRVHLAATPDDADFVLVDDGETPAGCDTRAGSATKTVKVSADATAPDLVVGLAAADAADYRVYVRSRRLSPEAAAALFALTRRQPGHAVAGR
jgi:fructose-specific component phosphotransferase system IIB-like protein